MINIYIVNYACMYANDIAVKNMYDVENCCTESKADRGVSWYNDGQCAICSVT